jgi:hypothetical protein
MIKKQIKTNEIIPIAGAPHTTHNARVSNIKHVTRALEVCDGPLAMQLFNNVTSFR